MIKVNEADFLGLLKAANTAIELGRHCTAHVWPYLERINAKVAFDTLQGALLEVQAGIVCEGCNAETRDCQCGFDAIEERG